jgi:ABC-type transport system involved in multi-copper enzyme maturation permease subunit
MKGLWAVTVVTFLEGIRNRAFYGISIIALLLLAANLVVAGLFPQEIGKVAVDFALSTVSFAGLLVVLFIGINLVAKDLDRKTIYMVLSRPISRQGYIVGKFFGTASLVVAAVLVLGLFAAASIFFTNMSFPEYFPRFAWGGVVLAMGYAALSLVLLTAVSLFFASFASNSFITLVLTVVVYVIGHSLSDVKSLLEGGAQVATETSGAMVTVVQGAYYLFPNLSLFDLKLQAAHGLLVPAPYLGWVALYGFGYSAFVIALAALVFSRREFP